MSIAVSTRRSFLKTIALAAPAVGLSIKNSAAAIAKTDLPGESLSFLKKSLILHTRSEWTDHSPRPWRMRAGGRFDRITFHHAGNGVNQNGTVNAVICDLRGVLTAHTERNYGDIGYHFMIDYSGAVWEGRSLAYEGAHVSGQNERNIGVMLLGNFEKQWPSKSQLNSVDTIAAKLRERYGIKRHRVFGHRDLGSTACPGRHFYPFVRRIKA